MKALKKTLLTLLALVVILVVIAFFLPRQAHVERSLTINAPAKVVYAQINDLHCWNKWAVWNQIDTAMQVEYINNGIGEGAGYTWTSAHKQVGNGKLTVTAAVPYDSIATVMDFMEQGVASGYFLFKESGDSTTVVWGFDSDLGTNPMSRWFGLLFDKMLGPDFEKGLQNLKTISEQIVAEKSQLVEIVQLKDIPYVGIREMITYDVISDKMGAMYGKLMQFATKNGLQMSDAPFAVYHLFDGTNIDLECALPVASLPEAQAGFVVATLPAAKYATTMHWGSYEKLDKTHKLLQEWVDGHKFELAAGPIERYLTDPMSEPDTAKWQTAVYYPIK